MLLYRHFGKILSIISNLSLLVLPITTGHQLSITDKVIAILKPVEDINHSVSSGRASASMLILFVRTQRGSWESNDDHGIQTMKMKMLYFLNDRYCDVESNESLVCATLLNPCIKDRFFSCSTVHLYAKTVGDKTFRDFVSELSTSTNALEPQPTTSIMKAFDAIIEEADDSIHSICTSTGSKSTKGADASVDFS